VLAENDQEYVTFGEFYTVVHSLANFLEEIGFGKGDIAMICLPNSWHYAAMFLAASIRGGATTGLSDQHTTCRTQASVSHFYIQSNLDLVPPLGGQPLQKYNRFFDRLPPKDL
jgi:acyl-coenzyme A synthetase/AMP-(fatty) acid ligase